MANGFVEGSVLTPVAAGRDGLVFAAEPDPGSALLRTLARLSGETCHYAEPYLRNVAGEAERLVAFLVSRGGDVQAFGVALEEGGAFRRRLRFPTLPRVLAPGPAVSGAFWDGIRRHCRARRVQRVLVESFEGIPLEVPALGIEVWRRDRTEFVLDLTPTPEELWARMSPKHRTRVRKAERNNSQFTVTDSLEACRQHVEAVSHSFARRAARGERVPGAQEAELYFRLLSVGAGQIVRLERDGRVLSSVLLLITSRCAYYESAGTSEEGMGLGASHALTWRTILHLRERGVTQLDLGGVTAQDSEGLRWYKAGFTAREVQLAHVEFATAGLVSRRFWQAADVCRQAPARLVSMWRRTENGATKIGT